MPSGRLGRFVSDTSGAIVPMVAVLLPLVAMTTIFSMEYAKALSDRENVASAADAAVLMGARSIAVSKSNYTGETEEELREEAVRIATDAFRNATVGLNLEEEIAFDVDFSIEDDVVDGELNFQGTHGTLFKVFSEDAFKLEIETEASVPIRPRVDFHFVIDNSASMNVGASASDQQIMIDRSGCAFACHRGSAANHPDYLRNQGARLRLDVVRDAVATAVEQLSEVPDYQIDIHVAVHTFSNSAEHPIPLTNDHDKVKTDLASIDSAKQIWQGGTNYHTSFDQISALIAQGDRAFGAVVPNERYVILLTDGIGGDVQWTVPYDGIDGDADHRYRQEPNFTVFSPKFSFSQGLDPFACEAFYGLPNTEVAIMELEYLSAGRSGGHVSALKNFIDNVLRPRVSDNAQDCATVNGNVYRADDADEIRDGMDELVEDIIEDLGLRLTK